MDESTLDPLSVLTGFKQPFLILMMESVRQAEIRDAKNNNPKHNLLLYHTEKKDVCLSTDRQVCFAHSPRRGLAGL